MKSTRDAFGDEILVAGAKNSNLLALSADLGKATRIDKFGTQYPDRFFEVGIAENNMIGIASGLSEYGYKVFLASFASFLTGKYDTIRCSLAYANAPCILVGTHSGMAIGRDGVTQMGLEDMSLMRSLPGMKILNPATYNECRSAVRYLAENDLHSPHYLRLGRQPVEELFTDTHQFEFGKGLVVRGGGDAVIFSTGCVLPDVMAAANNLYLVGINITVVNMTTIKPVDKDIILKYASRCKKVFTVEDHNIIGGLGTAVAEVMSESGVSASLCRIGLNDTFPESAPPADLYEKYGLSATQIKKRVLDELGE